MSAESELRALLVATAGVTALVGTRVRAERAEQSDARPFVVFSRTGTDIEQSLFDEVLGTKAVFEVACWADNRASAEAVADAVQTALVADHRAINSRAGGYDGDLDLEVAVLSVDWWD